MVTKAAGNQPPLDEPGAHERLPEHELLSVFIGKWITVGRTVPTDDSPALSILASDVYEWVPGGLFVLHVAYGRIGDSNVGGIEIIGYDAEAQKYRTHFFDSQGNISSQDLSVRDGVWTWSGEHARASAVVSDDGNALPTRHEWSDDGVHWRPSMDVTLRKVV
jgi:Protein of unknown function (DUF1579)